MRVAAWLAAAVLALMVVVLALVTLGAYAALTTGAPLWLRSFGSVETAVYDQLGLGGLPGFTRATILAVVTSVLAGVVAYLKPRR